MKILLITDTHYWVNITWSVHPSWISTYWNLIKEYEKVSLYIQEHNLDYLIHLWDISCVKLEDKVEKMKKFISYIQCKNKYFLPWNHDIFDLCKEEKKYFWYDTLPVKLSFWDTEIFLLDINLKDGLWYIAEKSLQTLDELFISSRATHKIVCCHYPCSEKEKNICPYHLLKNNNHKSFLTNSSEIRQILENYWVKKYISWHTHFFYQENINWVEHITLPAFGEDNGIWKANQSFAILDTENWDLTYHTL